jgi:nitrite reductase (NO-forming)
VFFGLGVAFLVAAAGAGVLDAAAGIERGRWLPLHLAFVGGVSQLVIGAAQFFAGAFLQTDPPPRWLFRSQVVAWNAGTLAVAYGVMAGDDPLTAVGGVALAAGLALFAAGLLDLRRRSLRTAPWAVRWYLACAAFLAVGVAAGVALANGAAWTSGDLLSAHLMLNLGGWFGTAILGTLHTFYPSLTQTQLRFPRLQGPTFLAWAGGVAATATGYALGADALTVAGWAALLGGAGMLAANVVGCALAGRPVALPGLLVTVGQACLVAGLLIALAAVASGETTTLIGADRAAAGTLVVAGWIGLTVLGSLLHLLAVVARVRNLAAPPPAIGLPAVVAPLAGAAVLAVAFGQIWDAGALEAAGKIALAAAYAACGIRIISLVVRAVRAAPLRV